MSSINDKLSSPEGLIASGAGLGLGAKGLYDSSRILKGLSTWEDEAEKLKDLITPGKHKFGGLSVQTSLADTDKIYDAYYRNRNKILNSRLLGVKLKNLLAKSDLRHLDLAGFADDLGTEGKGKAFSDFFRDRVLGTKSISAKNWDIKEPDRFINLDDITNPARKALQDMTGIEEGHDKLKKLLTKDKLNVFNRFALGHATTGSGIAEIVNGSHFAKGNTQKYVQALRNMARRSGGVAGAVAGLGALGLGTGLYNKFTKEASTKDNVDVPQGLASLALIAAGGLTTPEAIEGAKLTFGPANNTLGFSYGAYGDIGDGHKTPAANLRALFDLNDEKKGPANEAYLRELGLSDREIRDIKKLKLHDLARLEDGVNVANLPDKFNTIINTGMGHNVASQAGADGLSSGWVGRNNFGGVDRRIVQQTADLAPDTVINYMTDLASPHTAGGGATLEDARMRRLQGGRENIALTYGDEAATAGYHAQSDSTNKDNNLAKRLKETKGLKRVHVNNGSGIAPALSADTVNFLSKYPTREAAAEALQQALDANPEVFDRIQGDAHNSTRIKDLLDFKRKGGKIITIAGSGRGDYTVSRALALMEALERKGIKNVKVVPLLGQIANQSGFAKNEGIRLTNRLAERLEQALGTKNFTALSALYPSGNGLRPYDLMQALSDVNLASTGTSALAEAAHSGNLNFIPTQWSDAKGGAAATQNRHLAQQAKEDLLTGLLGDESVALADGTKSTVGKIGYHAPELDSWNRGNMEQAVLHDNFRNFDAGAVAEGQSSLSSKVLNRQKALARRLASSFSKNFSSIKPGVFENAITNQGFNMDGIADLIRDPKALKAAQDTALNTALQNIDSTKNAQRDIVRTVMGSIKKNNLLNRVKGVGLMAIPAASFGLGGYGLYDAIHNQNDYKNKLLAAIPTTKK